MSKKGGAKDGSNRKLAILLITTHGNLDSFHSLDSDENIETLKKAAYEIFMEQTHKEYVKKMLLTSYMGNMDQVLEGFHSLPKPYKWL